METVPTHDAFGAFSLLPIIIFSSLFLSFSLLDLGNIGKRANASDASKRQRMTMWRSFDCGPCKGLRIGLPIDRATGELIRIEKERP